jgi:maltose-binding protein MalE
MDSLSLFYNKTLMRDRYDEYAESHRNTGSDIAKIMINPPATWDDLISFIKLYGENAIAMGGSAKTQNSADILTALMLQYGVKMTNDDNSAALFQTAANQFTDEAYPGTRALEFYTSFAQQGSQNYTWNKDNDAYLDFANGKVAMMINYSRVNNDLSKTDVHPSIAGLPQINDSNQKISLASYNVLTVPKSSKNQANAWKLISYLSSSGVTSGYQNSNNLHSAFKKDPDLINPQSQQVDLQNQSAQSWYNPDPTKVKTILEKAIDQVLAGNKAQTVLEGAAAQVTTLLGEIK